MPSGQAAGVSRRSLLASIPLAAFSVIAAGGCQRTELSQPAEPRQSRQFGLAATGLDDATVQRSQAAARAVGQAAGRADRLRGIRLGAFAAHNVLDAAAAAGCTPELTWEPWDPRTGKHQEA